MSVNEAAKLFADWCHRVGEVNPRQVTLQVFLAQNTTPTTRPHLGLTWARFVLIWTSPLLGQRRLA